MTLHFRTTSGAHYETDGDRIRRHNTDSDTVKRADGEWVKLITLVPQPLKVGVRAFMIMEPLAAYGPDDHGNSGGPTTRTTTPVIEVWERP